MNLCEKKRIWTNVQAGFSPFKKHEFLRVGQKLFSLQEKRGVFLPAGRACTQYFFTAETRRRGAVAVAENVSFQVLPDGHY
jgi:hypothetical protein